MANDTLTGIIGYRRVKKRDAGPRAQAATDFVDRFVRAIGPLGPSHYLIQALDQRHAVIADVGALMRYAWFETEEDARRATSSEIEQEDGGA